MSKHTSIPGADVRNIEQPGMGGKTPKASFQGKAQNTRGDQASLSPKPGSDIETSREQCLKAPKDGSQAKAREITFVMDAPAAAEVLLAGDFTDWEKSPVKLIKGGGGSWHTKVQLAPGRHAYRFLVDGEWMDDPHTQDRVPNPYGTANSVVEIR